MSVITAKDRAKAIEAAQRLAQWCIDNGAADIPVNEDLELIEKVLRYAKTT